MENSRVALVSGQIQRLSAERVYAQDRESKLRKALALTRQRMALQPEVQTILDRTQQKLHQQTVGLFETLLTSLNQDVLQGDQTIKLNLEYNRGIPELEIFAQRGTYQEDLWDGTGGALTNIVCTGLRLIALTRANLRPFLVLDEADNWCMPAAIPRFFNVFEQLAESLSIQTLFITHHDRQLFGDSTHIIRLAREGDKTVPVNAVPPVWTVDQPGIRWIKLSHVRLLEDTTLHLSPGSNALTGDNGVGKSSVVAALRGIAYGEATDGIIQHGADSCQVDLGLEQGQVLQWVRVRKGSPKMRWVLLDAAGQTLRESTSAKGLPAWLEEVLGIAKQDKLDIQLLHQKTPVFLLDETASRQASILSVGQEAAYLPDLMQRYRKLLQEDQQALKRGESELGDMLEKIKQTRSVPAWETEIHRLQGVDQGLQERLQAFQQLANHTRFWETNLQVEHNLATEAALLEGLPPIPVFKDSTLMADLVQRWDREQSIVVRPLPTEISAPAFHGLEKLVQLGKDWATVSKVATAQVPLGVPALLPIRDITALSDTGKHWVAREQEITELQEALRMAETQVAQAFAELEAAWHEAGSCPLCGQGINLMEKNHG